MEAEKANGLVGFSTFPLSHLASRGKSGSLTPPKSLKRSGQLLVKTGWWTCPGVLPGPCPGGWEHRVLFGEKPQEERGGGGSAGCNPENLLCCPHSTLQIWKGFSWQSQEGS